MADQQREEIEKIRDQQREEIEKLRDELLGELREELEAAHQAELLQTQVHTSFHPSHYLWSTFSIKYFNELLLFFHI